MCVKNSSDYLQLDFALLILHVTSWNVNFCCNIKLSLWITIILSLSSIRCSRKNVFIPKKKAEREHASDLHPTGVVGQRSKEITLRHTLAPLTLQRLPPRLCVGRPRRVIRTQNVTLYSTLILRLQLRSCRHSWNRSTNLGLVSLRRLSQSAEVAVWKWTALFQNDYADVKMWQIRNHRKNVFFFSLFFFLPPKKHLNNM